MFYFLMLCHIILCYIVPYHIVVYCIRFDSVRLYIYSYIYIVLSCIALEGAHGEVQALRSRGATVPGALFAHVGRCFAFRHGGFQVTFDGFKRAFKACSRGPLG